MAAVTLAVLCPVAAQAQTRIDVNNVSQLVQAFATADANPDIYYSVYMARLRNAQGQVIPWVPTATLTLNKGKVFLYGSETGVNPERYIIDGQATRQLFRVKQLSTSAYKPMFGLYGVTVQNGWAKESGGGAVWITNADYFGVQNAVIKNNQGHLFAGGMLIEDVAYVDIYQSIIDGNKNDQRTVCGGGQTGGGGGIGFIGAVNRAYINKSTFLNNASCRGGAIEFFAGRTTVDITNSTFSANTASRRGGALFFNGGAGNATIRFTTIAFNKAGTLGWTTNDQNFGGGIALQNFNGFISVAGTIIAKNTVMNQNQPFYGLNTDDCFSQNQKFINGFKDNIMGKPGNCNFGVVGEFGIGSDTDPVDPRLGALQVSAVSHGQPLPMHKLQADSPARSKFYANEFYSVVHEDQRGYSRPYSFDGINDAGAVEFEGVR